MKKRIIITNKQHNKLITQINEGKHKPSAQDQVNNKVNAGIMDVVSCCGLMEEKDSDFDYNSSINSILKFIVSEGLNISPYPSVELNWEEQDGLFIKTGYYLPTEKKIVLFCKNRHEKDVLRSFAHELIHHMQNIEGKNMNFTNNDDVKDNSELEELESEAYLKGNILFRKWTEYERKKGDILQENKNIILKSDLYEYRIKETIKDKINNSISFNGDYISILDESIGKDSYDNYIPYCEMIDNIFESLSPNEVDLKSFNIKSNLNPKFWKDGKLDSRIRIKLLDIADDFIDFMGINWVKPEDIIITGSLANYNWDKKYSDIDLHILIDYKKVDKRVDFVKNYFYSQKKIWNDEHENIKIFGFPIEIYVQDINEKHVSSGIYSLEKNEWIVEPNKEKLSKIDADNKKIKEKVSNYTKEIDELIVDAKTDDEYKLRKLLTKSEKLFDEIKSLRRKGLNKKNDEMSSNNIIFKSLRRNGYIEKLSDLNLLIYDKMNSLS